jgi:hypothetical protein
VQTEKRKILGDVFFISLFVIFNHRLHRFTLIFSFGGLDELLFLTALIFSSVLIKPFQGLRECGQSPQALICVNNFLSPLYQIPNTPRFSISLSLPHQFSLLLVQNVPLSRC